MTAKPTALNFIGIDLSAFEPLFRDDSDLKKYGGSIKFEHNPSTGETRNMRADIDLKTNETGTRTRRSYSLPCHPRGAIKFENEAVLFIDTNEHNGAWLTTSCFVIKDKNGDVTDTLRCDLWEDKRVSVKDYGELKIDKEIVGIFWHLLNCILNMGVKNTLIRVFNDANLDQLDLVREFLLEVMSNTSCGLEGNDFDICYISDKFRDKHKHNALFSRIDKLHRQIDNGNVKTMREAGVYVNPERYEKADEITSEDKAFDDFIKIPIVDGLFIYSAS